MKHIPLRIDDVPAAPLLIERRRIPDRRVVWRGGRRDSDWLRRPCGVWDGDMDLRQPRRWQALRGSLSLFF